MKKRNIILAVVAVVAILVCAFVMQDGDNSTGRNARGNTAVQSSGKVSKNGVWKSAQYLTDTELGDGKKTLYVEVVAQEQSIKFTIHTDKKTVGAALSEHKLIEGEPGPYGMYVKKVNGMEADYDKDQTYWAFNKDGEAMLTGIDGAEFSEGDSFELVKTK